MEEKNSFKVSNIIKESILLYKNNFKLFISINLYIILIGLVLESLIVILVQNQISNVYNLQQEPNFLIMKINLILICGLLYLSSRFVVVQVIAIRKRYILQDVEVKNVFKESRKYVWKFIRVSILLGLLLLVPMIVINLGDEFICDGLGKMVIIFILICTVVYIIVKCFFATSVSILNHEIKHCIIYSIKLVKKNFIKVLLIYIFTIVFTFVTVIISTLLVYCIKSFLGTIYSLILVYCINAFIKLLLWSLMSCIINITYFKLDNGLELLEKDNKLDENNELCGDVDL